MYFFCTVHSFLVYFDFHRVDAINLHRQTINYCLFIGNNVTHIILYIPLSINTYLHTEIHMFIILQ